MQFYISVMFLGFPDEIHKEKPSFLDFENNWLRTDGPTDGQTLLKRCEDASKNKTEKKVIFFLDLLLLFVYSLRLFANPL